ncbi:uncharacterized protein ARMOST_08237 [Armillaria ostoyae]|uniref:Uncharacterized protein n=1 Tax=Armillaria ostoyae TaxID=47428 RepID=A0A284R823_ARMOS|nr:uncharacterized protein ARMOST_08237 [Armillaria ostoyae]
MGYTNGKADTMSPDYKTVMSSLSTQGYWYITSQNVAVGFRP